MTNRTASSSERPTMQTFEPTREAALQRLDAVDPSAYARTRNALDGAVTRLSPYITHGFISLREVYDTVQHRHRLDVRHKFVFELGWRAYWRHVWTQQGDEIQHSLHAGPLPDEAYSRALPQDVLMARSGIPAIDMAVRELLTTGYLHNHARMWLASYLVHLRKVYWHVGAQWMLGHLLDGDVASNHLSWQWVAGTGSSKPYLFNADNVARYAPVTWHSGGTAIDTTYEALEAVARSATLRLEATLHPSPENWAPPALRASPTDDARSNMKPWHTPGASDALPLRGRDVWLLHPWAVHVDLNTQPDSVLCIGVGLENSHVGTPWDARRWDFVTRGLQEQASQLWWGTASQIAVALQHARSVQWQSDPHVDLGMAALRSQLNDLNTRVRVVSQAPPPLFAPVERPCRSFSDWWGSTHIA